MALAGVIVGATYLVGPRYLHPARPASRPHRRATPRAIDRRADHRSGGAWYRAVGLVPTRLRPRSTCSALLLPGRSSRWACAVSSPNTCSTSPSATLHDALGAALQWASAARAAAAPTAAQAERLGQVLVTAARMSTGEAGDLHAKADLLGSSYQAQLVAGDAQFLVSVSPHPSRGRERRCASPSRIDLEGRIVPGRFSPYAQNTPSIRAISGATRCDQHAARITECNSYAHIFICANFAAMVPLNVGGRRE